MKEPNRKHEQEPDAGLDDTVADEAIAEGEDGAETGAPARQDSPATTTRSAKSWSDEDETIALTEPDGAGADIQGHPVPQRPPPPVPVFGHSVADRRDEDRPLTERLVPREPAPVEPASSRRWRPDLSDTPGLEEDRHAYVEAVEDDRDIDDIFDRPEQTVAGSTAEYDPEAGRTNVAVKIQAVRQVVRSATSTPFGRLMVSLPIGLAGLALAIMAVTLQDLWMVIAAVVVSPIGGVLIYLRYQAWLGHKRYIYRLLESLGEDVSDFDAAKAHRRIGKAVRRR